MQLLTEKLTDFLTKRSLVPCTTNAFFLANWKSDHYFSENVNNYYVN